MKRTFQNLIQNKMNNQNISKPHSKQTKQQNNTTFQNLFQTSQTRFQNLIQTKPNQQIKI
jgi:hypothetical protein